MARKLRVEHAGAVYHVFNRGIDRRHLFKDDQEYERFLENVETCVETYGVEVHAYCLMANHFHWVLKTPGPISAALCGPCSRLMPYNLRHRKSGHVFEGPFKSPLVE